MKELGEKMSCNSEVADGFGGPHSFDDDLAQQRLTEAREQLKKQGNQRQTLIMTDFGPKVLMTLPPAKERRYSPPDQYCYHWTREKSGRKERTK